MSVLEFLTYTGTPSALGYAAVAAALGWLLIVFVLVPAYHRVQLEVGVRLERRRRERQAPAPARVALEAR